MSTLLAIPSAFAKDGEENDLSQRLAYHESLDPTTAFLHLNPSDFSRVEQLTSELLEYAKQHLGKPYSRGSKGPKAFDCSGFTSYVFNNFDIKLAASSSAQFLQGEGIDVTEVRPGDLLFFSGRAASANRVGHVAIAVDVDENGVITFIHAAIQGGIRYDKYPDGGYYSRRYIGARRVIE